MYLLNQKDRVIKENDHANLHSTMYLLNPMLLAIVSAESVFTFHYVSIKSLSKTKADMGNFYLHSTMYLLNRRIWGMTGNM